jgi:RNA polymerase primary sigma factor
LPRPFSKEEEKRIFQKLEREPNNIEIRNKIIIRNLRLVCQVAKKLKYLREQYKVDLGDAVSYGISGLINAIKRFNWRRGYKFSTYAVTWIYEYTKYGIRKDTVIKKPEHFSELTRKYKKINQSLTDCDKQEQMVAEKTFSQKELKKIKENDFSIISLDVVLGNEEKGKGLIDLIGFSEKGYQEVEERDNRKRILFFLKTHLDEKETFVLVKSTGLLDDSPWTLAKIGRFFHVSRERIRQIKNKAIKKLGKGRKKALLKQLLT